MNRNLPHNDNLIVNDNHQMIDSIATNIMMNQTNDQSKPSKQQNNDLMMMMMMSTNNNNNNNNEQIIASSSSASASASSSASSFQKPLSNSLLNQHNHNNNLNLNNHYHHNHHQGVNRRMMYAATANNVVFTYGRGKKALNALNNITIKVPVGTIYAILGPSGCGKTTLVHSLVGSIKPKSGFVKVFGEIPGSARSLVPGPGVGYMPQEIGLFDEFTIKETLFFFGRLYRLPYETIKNRTEFLLNFLELPDKDCFVSKLSGGQKRRVSLAAALVHKPPLLVLDEPTVGIDPLLRQSIWYHLRSLSKNDGITIIITTHYIDEAHQANQVAFMRYGTLLEEGNPQELIKKYQLNNLEEVFLALCNNTTTTTTANNTINNNNNNNSDNLKKSSSTSMDAHYGKLLEILDYGREKPLLSLASESHKAYNGDDDNNDNDDDDDDGTATNKLMLLNKQTEISLDQPQQQDSSDANGIIMSSSTSFQMEIPTATIDYQQQQQHNFNQTNLVKRSTLPITTKASASVVTSTIQQQQQNVPPPPVAQRLFMKRNKILDHFARSSALLTKNFIRMWRNLPVMLFASLIPVLQCTLFFLCLGRNPYDIPVSVYNAELDPLVNPVPYQKNLFSVEFLNEIDNKTINLVNVQTLQEGYDTVRNGKSKALLVFGANFTSATYEKALDFMSLEKDVLKQSFVDLYLDMSAQFHVLKIKEKIFEAYHSFSRKILAENGYLPELADPPIHIPPPIMGLKDPTVTEFMAPGFIMSLSFYASIATAALTLVLERKDGLLERSLVSGVYPNEYIISHVITQTVIVIIQIILVLLMTFFIFHIPNQGPVFWISVLIVMQGVCGMAYGILISAIAKEENFTLAACMGSMFPQFLLSGVVWPVDTMPQFLIYVSTFISQAKAIDAVRFMLYRGWDPFNHWDVTLGFIISASWTVVFLFIATILFNINKS